MAKKLFEKGNPGKQKGTVSKTTKAAKEVFVGIMEGEVDNVQKALQELFKKDKEAYLNCLSKFFPYFIPKMTEISTPPGEGLNFTINKIITKDVRGNGEDIKE